MSCKRTDCLYHPNIDLGYNCDYILLTGKKRGCKSGRKCDKYVQATPKEQFNLRKKAAKVSFCDYNEEVCECDIETSNKAP